MANPLRTIAIVTGSRAEYGLLRSTIRAVAAHDALTLRVVVAGSHLVAGTDADVAADGFRVDARVRMQEPGVAGRAADARAVGRGVGAFAENFARLDPLFIVVLGDRIEAFAAAAAASVGGCRVAHLHGGDRAEGVADEAMRHAITKLAHLHLPATAASAERIVRMGEDPAAVCVVGSPAMDGLGTVEPAADAPECVVMLHPIGRSDDEEAATARAVLDAVGVRDVVCLSPNLDPGRTGIARALAASGLRVLDHLPRDRFLSTLKGARVIVGNSSAGLIEAAALGTACVNVGPRQAGRERAGNVIDVPMDRDAIAAAVERALATDCAGLPHPYGDGRTGERVAALLAEIELDALSVRKRNAY